MFLLHLSFLYAGSNIQYLLYKLWWWNNLPSFIFNCIQCISLTVPSQKMEITVLSVQFMKCERNYEAIMKFGRGNYKLFWLFFCIKITSVELNSAVYYKGCTMSQLIYVNSSLFTWIRGSTWKIIPDDATSSSRVFSEMYSRQMQPENGKNKYLDTGIQKWSR